jgi:hypothetical protein
MKNLKSRNPGKAQKATEKEIDRRYMLLELACKERHCDPCTYPDCQRFSREMGKKKPFTTSMFELRTMETEGRVEADRRYVVVELACKEKHCDPCTYPDCQRYVREFTKKERFTTPLFEMSREDWKKTKKASLGEGEEVAA